MYCNSKWSSYLCNITTVTCPKVSSMCLSLAGVSGSAVSIRSNSSSIFLLVLVETVTCLEEGVIRRPLHREDTVGGGAFDFKGFCVMVERSLSKRYS